MNKMYKYKVSEELQVKAAKELFFTFYLKKIWVFLIILIAMSIALTIASRPGQFPLHYVTIAITALLIFIWVLTYFNFIKNAKTYFETIDGDKTQTIEFNETEIIIEVCGNTKKISWNKIDEVQVSKSFLIFIYKKLPLICIPKNVIGNDLEEIKNQIKNKHKQ